MIKNGTEVRSIPKTDNTNKKELEARKIAVSVAIKTLTPKQKKIFELYYTGNFTITEIASKLGISKQAVSKSIKTSLKKVSNISQN